MSVATAPSSSEALEARGRESVDLVITDLDFPKVDGLSLAEEFVEQDPDGDTYA